MLARSQKSLMISASTSPIRLLAPVAPAKGLQLPKLRAEGAGWSQSVGSLKVLKSDDVARGVVLF